MAYRFAWEIAPRRRCRRRLVGSVGVRVAAKVGGSWLFRCATVVGKGEIEKCTARRSCGRFTEVLLPRSVSGEWPVVVQLVWGGDVRVCFYLFLQGRVGGRHRYVGNQALGAGDLL